MSLNLFYITNNPAVALIAEKYGVDRIFVDLETLGKEERQKNMNSVKSHHSIDDIKAISSVLTTSELLVRVNPWNDNSSNEIEQVISSGADIIMLPMWKTVTEVKNFIRVVNKRTKTMLLLETKEAVAIIEDVLEIDGIDEIHIGLNDLHLSYGMNFMFELLANGTVEKLCDKIKTKNILYGFGGIARLGEGLLPSEKIIMEHHRLGSTRVILSRTFCDVKDYKTFKDVDRVFEHNMRKLRNYEDMICTLDDKFYYQNQSEVIKTVENIVSNMRCRQHVL